MSKQTHTMKWTPAQRRAIETVGRPVLVAASAGTGKTAALSGRAVARMADPRDPAQADNLLVLTFTDAAAEEMRSRIAETLHQWSRRTRDPQLGRQLLLLDRAPISTIHAFCKRVLTEFFYLAGLDPAFGILDADEQKLLKSEALDETLEEAWADETLAQGMTTLFEGRRVQAGANSFIDRIIPLSEFLDSVVSRDDFYARAAAAGDLQTAACDELEAAQKDILLKRLAECRARLDYALRLDAAHCGGGFASAYIHDKVMPEVEQCRVLLEQKRFELCREHLAGLDFGRMPAFSKKNQWPEEYKDLITAPVKHVRDQLKRLADFALLSGGYAQRIAPQASLQTKVLLELLGRFDRVYTQAKRRRNVLDFADLEHQTLRLLKSRPEAAASLRRRFEYIFVDEYQDINAVQQGLLECLRRDDNLFVVGDVKQSIYGFRQSRPEIFLNQLRTAADADTPSTSPCRIDLQENFRCRGEIIDFVNALFSRLMTEGAADMDYDSRAALVSAFDYPPFKASGGPPEPVEVVLLDEDIPDEDAADETAPDNGQDESPAESDAPDGLLSVTASQRQAAWIAQRIRQLVGADGGKPELEIFDKKTHSTRPVEYRDIVILMRSLSHKARDYVEILRLAGVPVSSQSACGYFEAAEIADCLCLLKTLDNPDRDIELAGLLRSPIFHLTDTELADIRLGADKTAGFYQALRQSAEQTGSAIGARCREILAAISNWRQEARCGSLADLLDRIFREHNLLAFYAALPNGAQRRANLLKLHDHAIQFEHFRTTDPSASLGRFVEFLEKLADGGQDWAPAEPDNSGENAVRLMSVHKSKGLEFPVVFAAELNTKFNMKDAAGECLISDQTLGLQILDRTAGRRYPSMAHQVIAERRRKANLAEEMRILYVALTRAREKLILTGSRKEQACMALLRQSAAAGKDLPDWMTAEGNCHLEWLMMGLGNGQTLRRLYAAGDEPAAAQDPSFFAQRVGREQLEAATRQILQSKRSLKSLTEPSASALSASKTVFEQVRHNLQWRYPFENAVNISAKFSVSELVRHDGPADTAFAARPEAVRGQAPQCAASADALAVGSAFHALFESLDLAGPMEAQRVQAALRRLTEGGKLDEATAKRISIPSVLSFFESPLGRLTLKHHTKVLREWPFTYALDARLAGAAAGGETVILQGIVDLIVPTEQGLVMIDFKTDRVSESDVAARSERYAAQLGYYAMAAGAILRQPVTSAWLYYLTPGRAFEIKL